MVWSDPPAAGRAGIVRGPDAMPLAFRSNSHSSKGTRMRADTVSEHEFKLGVPALFEVPAPEGEHHLIPTRTVELSATYWDTADLRLAQAGVSVRHRRADHGTENGWTVKLPAGSGNATMTSRTEVKFSGTRVRPPVGAVRLLQATTRGIALLAVAEIVTTRRGFDLVDEEDRVCAHVLDDLVHAQVAAEPIPVTFREIEVELVDQNAKAAKLFVELLRKAGADRPLVGSKIQHVLGVSSTNMASAGEQPTELSAAGLLRAMLTEAGAELLGADPYVRLGDDDEAVHRARVATRRLRSHLRTIAPALDEDWATATTEELRWLGDLLGSVRDLDVLAGRFTEHIQPTATSTPEVEPSGAEQLLAFLRAERSKARKKLLRALGSARYLQLLDRLVEAGVAPPLCDAVLPDAPVEILLRHVTKKTWRRLSKTVKRLGTEPSDTELHQVRRRAKQARYAAQLASRVVGKRAARLATALGRLQDVLGSLHDAVTAEQWLHRVVPADASADLVRVASELLTYERRARREALKRWRHEWKRSNNRELRVWF